MTFLLTYIDRKREVTELIVINVELAYRALPFIDEAWETWTLASLVINVGPVGVPHFGPDSVTRRYTIGSVEEIEDNLEQARNFVRGKLEINPHLSIMLQNFGDGERRQMNGVHP